MPEGSCKIITGEELRLKLLENIKHATQTEPGYFRDYPPSHHDQWSAPRSLVSDGSTWVEGKGTCPDWDNGDDITGLTKDLTQYPLRDGYAWWNIGWLFKNSVLAILKPLQPFARILESPELEPTVHSASPRNRLGLKSLRATLQHISLPPSKKGVPMNVQKLLTAFIGFLVIMRSITGRSGETINLSITDVQNIVSQKLEVARNQNNAIALEEASEAVKGKVQTNAVIYLHYEPEEAFTLKLQILKVATSMQDQSFSPKTRTKAGIYGKVPWPTEQEKPLDLVGKPLWVPGQNPEDFKASNPALYAFYKPLYEENKRNTEKHKREGLIRSIRKELFRDIRNSLKNASLDKKNPHSLSNHVVLVKEIINDEQLQQSILSDEHPENLFVK